MGVSTDAYLAYGYDLGEDPPSFLESWYDFEDFVENLAGVPQWESDEAWGSASKEERSRVYKLGQDAIESLPCSDGNSLLRRLPDGIPRDERVGFQSIERES